MRTESGSSRPAMSTSVRAGLTAHSRVGLLLVVGLTALGLGTAQGAQKRTRAPSPPASPSILDLQTKVKATASKFIPSVVNIASTVVVRDQAFSDEGLPFGLIPELPP